MLHALNKQTKPLMTPFFISKFVMLKKIKSTNQFLFKKKKIKSTSNEDVNPFLF